MDRRDQTYRIDKMEFQMSVKGLFSSTKRKLNPGNAISKGEFVCPVCKQQSEMMPLPAFYLAQWQKYQCIHNVFFAETLNLQHYNCSSCGASDRDRLYSLFLEGLFNSESGAIKLLDIAPACPTCKIYPFFSTGFLS